MTIRYARSRHGLNGWWAHLRIGRWMFSLQRKADDK